MLSPSPDPGAGAPLRAQLGLLVDLYETPAADLTEGETIDAVLALASFRDRAEAVLTEAVGAFDANKTWTVEAAASAAAWLANRTELDPAACRAIVERAHGLRECPVLRAAYNDGVVGTAKVTMLLTARGKVEGLFARFEAELIELIHHLTVAQARVVVRRWRKNALASLGLDDDGPDPCDEADNSMHVSTTFEGRRLLLGNLDAVNGAELEGHLEAEVDRLFQAGEFRGDDGLLPSQRTSIAHLNLVRRGALGGTKHGAPRPSVSLVLDLSELRGQPVDDVDDLLGRRCHLADGTLVPRSTAERLLCEADVTELVTWLRANGMTDVIATNHLRRHATATQRQILAERDRGCVFPGCSMPVKWTDAHHLTPYEICQTTHVDNLVLLCRHHHHAVHEGGYQMSRGPDGTIRVIRPEGTLLQRSRPGRQATEPDPAHPDIHDPPTVDAPARPTTRFRTLAERRDAHQRHLAVMAQEAQDGIDELHTWAQDVGLLDHLDPTA